MKFPWFIFILFSIFSYPIQYGCGQVTYYPVGKYAVISQPFGYKKHVGVDFNVPSGTSVRAAMDGLVTFAMDDSVVYGGSIMVLHNDGYASLYGHLSKLFVKKGEEVYAGQVIGLSGGIPGTSGAGQSSGAHLHFEIRIPGHLDNNLYNIDPIEYLDGYVAQMGSDRCPK